jgi:hypothetical protein
MYKSFTEMPVWKNTHGLSVDVFKMTTGLPKAEDCGGPQKLDKRLSSELT